MSPEKLVSMIGHPCLKAIGPPRDVEKLCAGAGAQIMQELPRGSGRG